MSSSSLACGVRGGLGLAAAASVLLMAGGAGMATGCVAHVGGNGSQWGWGESVKETRVLTVAAVAGKPIDVKSKNGGVTIKATKRSDVQITAKLQGKSQERLETVKVVAERQADGTLRIRPVWPEGESAWGWNSASQNDGCTFDIEVPDAAGVKVQTSNGGVTLNGLSGAAALSSSNGGVHVNEHAGDLTIDTSNGGVHVDGIDGALKVDTSNGSVEAKDVLGPVTVETSNAGVDVELAKDNAGPVHISSSNGGVDLTVGPAFKGTLVVDTSNGKVSVPSALGKVVKQSKTSATVEVGEGPKSVVDTSNGSVTVSRKG